MKRMIFIRTALSVKQGGLKALLLVAAMTFMGAVSVSAQTTDLAANTGPIKTLGAWKNTADAKDALLQQIDALNQQLNVGPSNPNMLKVKLTIYRDIVVSLEEGVPVPDAALANYNKYKPGLHSSADVLPALPTNDWQNIYSDMVGVLQL